MRWISPTEIGSTPANGSSSSISRGLVASARAISTRRRSPPDRLAPIWSATCVTCSSSIRLASSRSRPAAFRSSRNSSTSRILSATLSLRNTEGSCGR